MMYDLEGQDSQPLQETKSLGNLDIRLGFIRKVYGIICFQLLLTTFICLISMYSESFVKFQTEKYGLFIAAAVFSIIIMIAIFCYKKVARTSPTNYICLTSFTLCEAYMVSFACATTDKYIVLMAAAMTLGITVALTIYAMTTKTDLTVMGSTLFILLGGLILFGIFAFIFRDRILIVLYCILAVILYGYYLIYDTQLVVGGKTYQLEIDDYIIGAIIIYIDIIVLFLRLLQLLSILFGKR